MARAKTLPKPDANFVYSLYQLRTADGDEARLRLISRRMREYTTMRHKLNVPDAYKAFAKEIRTPFVRDTWHRTSTALNQRPYTIEIEPRDATNVAERAAEIGVRWDNAVRDVLDKEIGENTAIESTKALIRDGESVLKIVHRPDAWANFPEREASEDADSYLKKTERYKKTGPPLPFAWRVVDRLSMLFENGEFGDSWALEYGEYPRPYLGRQYTMVEASTGDVKGLVDPKRMLGGRPKPQGYLWSATGRAVKIEYFDQDWWHVVVDGADAPGFPKPNPYAPRLPYFRAKGPDSESLLYSLMYLVPALDELLTMKLNWSFLGAYPNPLVQQVPSALAMPSVTGDANEPTSLSWKPGKAIQVPVGWNMSFLVPPPTGKDLNDMAVLLREMIDVAGIPSVLRGLSGSGDSGYLANQMIAAAMLHLQLAGSSISHQFERAYEHLHWLIDHVVDDCVYVLAGPGKDQSGKQWLGLKPGNGLTTTEAGTGDLGPVAVEFHPTLPTDEQARAMIAMQLTNAPKPLISKRYALEKFLMVEDPDAVMDEIAVETALESEPLASMWLNRALEEAGLTPPPAAASPPAPAPVAPPGVAGAASGGTPAVPGLTMPLQPPTPSAPGLPAGSFPGQPNTPTATSG